MIKPIINFAVCFFFIFLAGETAQAQIPRQGIPKPGITLGGYVMYSQPKGAFDNAYKYGGGGEIFGGVGVGKTYIIVTAGLSKFHPEPGTHTGTLTYTPVKIGLKHFIFRKMLFVNADLGTAVVKNRTFNESRFTRGIGVGAKLLGLEASLYYDGWKNVKASGFANSVDFKIGWSLNL